MDNHECNDLEERLAASARLKEISDLIVSLKKHVQQYPANGYMISRLQTERLQIMQQFIRLVPPAEAVVTEGDGSFQTGLSLPSPHDV